MKVKVNLDTMKNINKFVRIVEGVEKPVFLVDGHLRVSAKSLLGALYTLEWNEVWCECEDDIYHQIEEFVI